MSYKFQSGERNFVLADQTAKFAFSKVGYEFEPPKN